MKATLAASIIGGVLGIDSIKVGEGDLLFAGEVGTYNGPWDHPDDLRKLNSVMRYSQGTARMVSRLTGMAYGNHWNSTDQIPERGDPRISASIGSFDPIDGGNTTFLAVGTMGEDGWRQAWQVMSSR